MIAIPHSPHSAIDDHAMDAAAMLLQGIEWLPTLLSCVAASHYNIAAIWILFKWARIKSDLDCLTLFAQGM